MQKIPSQVSVGTDLEMFLFDNKLEQIVPCVGILEGTKDSPYTPEGYPQGYAIQEDNVMVEYNIPPCQDMQSFYKSVRTGRSMVLGELQRRHGSKYGLYTRNHTHKFPPKYLMTDQAKQIGCEPDYDAYGGGRKRTTIPKPGLDRSCGGHIHIGGDFKCPDFVSALFAELFIGVRGQVHTPPTDPRMAWYGMPGIYRPKPYGIEYRTPNNKWAMSGSLTEVVGAKALNCAKYLTETDAVTLQAHFRKIPWVKVQSYMSGSKRTNDSQNLYLHIISEAQKVGVPV